MGRGRRKRIALLVLLLALAFVWGMPPQTDALCGVFGAGQSVLATAHTDALCGAVEVGKSALATAHADAPCGVLGAEQSALAAAHADVLSGVLGAGQSALATAHTDALCGTLEISEQSVLAAAHADAPCGVLGAGQSALAAAHADAPCGVLEAGQSALAAAHAVVLSGVLEAGQSALVTAHADAPCGVLEAGQSALTAAHTDALCGVLEAEQSALAAAHADALSGVLGAGQSALTAAHADALSGAVGALTEAAVLQAKSADHDERMAASDTTTPQSVSVSVAAYRIEKLCTLLVGKRFTTTGRACGNKACYRCNVKHILNAEWFQKTVDLLPDDCAFQHFYFDTPLLNGCSCCGFANFAGFYLFAQRSSDQVRFVQEASGRYCYETLQKARPGDVIRLGDYASGKGRHSAVVVTVDEVGVTVLDCNYLGNNKVGLHTIRYGKYRYVSINRAANYDVSDYEAFLCGREYLSNCTFAAAAFTVCLVRDGALLSLPAPKAQCGALQTLCLAKEGDCFTVNGVVTDADGGRWYRAELSGGAAYLWAADACPCAETDGSALHLSN